MRVKHPGIIFVEDWLQPSGISVAEFSLIWSCDHKKLSKFANGLADIDWYINNKLVEAFGTNETYWYNKQMLFNDYQINASV